MRCRDCPKCGGFAFRRVVWCLSISDSKHQKSRPAAETVRELLPGEAVHLALEAGNLAGNWARGKSLRKFLEGRRSHSGAEWLARFRVTEVYSGRNLVCYNLSALWTPLSVLRPS